MISTTAPGISVAVSYTWALATAGLFCSVVWLFLRVRMIDFLRCFDLPLTETHLITTTNWPGETNRAVQDPQAQAVPRGVGGQGRGPPCDRDSSAHADRASQQEAEAQAD